MLHIPKEAETQLHFQWNHFEQNSFRLDNSEIKPESRYKILLKANRKFESIYLSFFQEFYAREIGKLNNLKMFSVYESTAVGVRIKYRVSVIVYLKKKNFQS